MTNQPQSPLKNIRILAIPSAVGVSCLTRLILIARILKQVGATVAFAFKNPHHPILQAEHFQTFPVADATITDFNSNIYAAYPPALIQQCLDDEKKAIQTFNPHLILSDFRLTAAISARIAKIPLVTVVNGYLTDYFNLDEAMLSEFENKKRLQAPSFIVKTIQNRQRKILVRHFRNAARKHKLKKLNTLHNFLAGDLTLISELPKFCPLYDLPDHHRYIGPLIWEDTTPTDKKQATAILAKLDPTRPIIYATIGNTGDQTLINLVINTFKDDKNYQIVITTGTFIDPTTFPKANNIHITRFIPGSQIIPRAIAVIHAGGSGTTYQTLLNGAPAIIIPFNNQQRINAWLTKKQHLGISLDSTQLTPTLLRQTLTQLLADTQIKQNITHLQAEWPQDKAAHVAALRIGYFFESLS